MTTLEIICLYGLGISLCLLLFDAAGKTLRAAWRRNGRRYGVAASLIGLAVVCTINAQKPNPPVITVDSFLADAGSYATNDVLHVAVTNAPAYAGIDFSSCPVLVYARQRGLSDAPKWEELLPRRTFSELPADYAIEDATNYNYLVYLDYVPPSPVHTNGVFELRGFMVPGDEPGNLEQLAAGFINSRAILPPPTARDYVQDGLIAMWDGIENAGWGVHNPNATEWKDLVGDNDITLVGGVFGDTALICNGTQYGGHNDNVVNGVQIELVANAKQQKRRCWIASTGQSLSSKYSGFVGWYDRGLCFGLYDTARSLTLGTAISYSFAVNSNRTFENNALVATESGKSDLTPQAARGICVVVGGQMNNPLKCDIHCLRIYSRALTDEEIAHNYKIDKERFNLP